MQINMHQAKSQLSALTEKALAGEMVVIAKAGKPLVQLVPYTKAPELRKPGQYKNQIQIPEGFDAPDKEIEAMFYGE